MRGAVASDALLRPAGLSPSRPPLVVVCGAPGSGKSTYVRGRAAPDDLVLDLDDIITEIGGGSGWRHPSRVRWLPRALEERNRRLRALADSDAQRVWLIVGAARPEDRDFWASVLSAREVVVLMTPLAETLRRIDADPVRTLVRRQIRVGAVAWWVAYGAREGDTLVGVSP